MGLVWSNQIKYFRSNAILGLIIEDFGLVVLYCLIADIKPMLSYLIIIGYNANSKQ